MSAAKAEYGQCIRIETDARLMEAINSNKLFNKRRVSAAELLAQDFIKHCAPDFITKFSPQIRIDIISDNPLCAQIRAYRAEAALYKLQLRVQRIIKVKHDCADSMHSKKKTEVRSQKAEVSIWYKGIVSFLSSLTLSLCFISRLQQKQHHHSGAYTRGRESGHAHLPGLHGGRAAQASAENQLLHRLTVAHRPQTGG